MSVTVGAVPARVGSANDKLRGGVKPFQLLPVPLPDAAAFAWNSRVAAWAMSNG